MTDPDTPLPGLEPAAPVDAGAVELAARRTITALEGDIDERHAVIAQTLLTVARQLDRAANARNAKDYGVANLVAQLRETYLVLAVDNENERGDGDPFDRLARELGRAAAVRDAPQPSTTE